MSCRRETDGDRGKEARSERAIAAVDDTLAHTEGSGSSHHLPHPFCPCAYCQTSAAAAVAVAASDSAQHIMEQHYAPYHHPYYR